MENLTESQIAAKINDSISEAQEMLMEKAVTANCLELIEIIRLLVWLKLN